MSKEISKWENFIEKVKQKNPSEKVQKRKTRRKTNYEIEQKQNFTKAHVYNTVLDIEESEDWWMNAN